MANSKSAIKRIRINERNKLKNKLYKGTVKTSIKIFLHQLDTYKLSQQDQDRETAKTLLNSVYKLIDKSTKKNVFRKNTAARKKSNLFLKLRKSRKNFIH